MIKKILVIHTSFIGDAILALPFLKELQQKYPEAAIDVITAPRAHDIFRSSPYVQKIQILDKRRKHKSLFATIRFGFEQRSEKYEAVYCLHRSIRSTVLVWATGVRPSYGFSTATASFLYDKKIPYLADKHEVQRILAFTENVYDGESWKILPEMQSSQYAGLVDEYITKNIPGKRFICIAPGSVWATKRYPVEHFITVCKNLTGKGYAVVLLGGPDEKAVCAEIANNTKVINACAALPLLAVKELLSHTSALITNDSALGHFGVAANTAVLTIYCSTVPEFGFYPYNANSSTIQVEGLECKPCGIHGHNQCPKKHFRCGYDIAPENVVEKLISMIKD